MSGIYYFVNLWYYLKVLLLFFLDTIYWILCYHTWSSTSSGEVTAGKVESYTKYKIWKGLLHYCSCLQRPDLWYYSEVSPVLRCCECIMWRGWDGRGASIQYQNSIAGSTGPCYPQLCFISTVLTSHPLLTHNLSDQRICRSRVNISSSEAWPV